MLQSPRIVPYRETLLALCITALAAAVLLTAAPARAQMNVDGPQPGDLPFVGGLRQRLAQPGADPEAGERSGPRLWPILDFTNGPEGATPHRSLWPFFRQGVWRRGENTERVFRLLTLVPFMPLFGRINDDAGRSKWEALAVQWGVSPEDADEWFFYILPLFGYKQNDAGYRHILLPPLFAWWNRGEYRSLFVLPVFMAWDAATPPAADDAAGEQVGKSRQLAHFSLTPLFSWSREGVRPRAPAFSWKTESSWGLFPLAWRTRTDAFSSFALGWPLFVRRSSSASDLTSMLLGLLFRHRELRAQPIEPQGAREGDPDAFRFVTRDLRILTLFSRVALRAKPDDEIVGLRQGLLPLWGYERAPNDARHFSLLSPLAQPFRDEAPEDSRSWAALLGLVNYRKDPGAKRRVFNLFDIRLLKTGGLLRYEADGVDRELRLLAPWGFGPRLRWKAGSV